MIKYTLQITPKDIDTTYEIILNSKKNKQKRLFTQIISVIMLLLLLCTLIFSTGSTVYAIFMGILTFVFAGYIFFAKQIQKWQLKNRFKKSDPRAQYATRTYIFDEEGITIQSDFGDSKRNWSSFKGWNTFNEYIYVITIEGQLILVNSNQVNQNEKEELLHLLDTYLIQYEN